MGLAQYSLSKSIRGLAGALTFVACSSNGFGSEEHAASDSSVEAAGQTSIETSESSGDLGTGSNDACDVLIEFSLTETHIDLPRSSFLISEDLDRDGYRDLITGEGVVLLGTGGAWTSAPSVLLPDESSVLFAGDSDGDDMLDLLGHDANGRIFIAYGLGDGTFASPVLHDVGTPDPVGHAIFAGDLDGNGREDVFILYQNGNRVKILDDESGALVERLDLTMPSPSVVITGADLDEDGHLDVITDSRDDRTVRVHFGSPEATLLDPVEIAIGLRAIGVPFSSPFRTGFPAAPLTVFHGLLGQETGALLVITSSTSRELAVAGHETGFGIWPVAFGDYDRDGDFDVAGARQGSPGEISFVCDCEQRFAFCGSVVLPGSPAGLATIGAEGADELAFTVAGDADKLYVLVRS